MSTKKTIPFPETEKQDAAPQEASPTPEPQPAPSPAFVIPLSVLQNVVNYLVTRPYQEVGSLIKEIEATAKKV